ncbi:MAG: DnaA/Hda family protein, partial [bacterium]|nr:DnaA/Hda family protein [bacterium]
MKTDVWTAFLRVAGDEVDDEKFRGMIKQVDLLEANEEVIIIGVTSKLMKSRLEEKYRELIEVLLERVTGRFRRVEFSLVKPKKPANKGREWSGSPRLTGYLNSKYTFDSFVIGKSNEFAYAATESVAKFPGKRYNPLFLYGGVGLGKTHLMQAVGHYCLENRKDAKIAYISSERFTNELITSLRGKSTESFRKKYRKLDLLLVDDVQFFSG